MNHSTKTTTVSINDSDIPDKLKKKYQKDYNNQKIIIGIICLPLIIFLVFFIIPKFPLIIWIILILGLGYLGYKYILPALGVISLYIIYKILFKK